MRAVIYFLLQPIVIGLLLFCFFYLFSRTWHVIRIEKWYIPGLIWLLITGVSPLPWWCARHVEQQYQVLQDVNSSFEKIYILVLGSGHTQDEKLQPLHQTSPTGLSRLTEGLRHYNKLDSAFFVTSGYSKRSPVSQAEVMAMAVVSLGVEPRDTLHLPKARTTLDEIDHFVERFGNKSPIILVTSALHMPRAMRIAKSRGLRASPAPCDYIAKRAIDDPGSTLSMSGQHFITSDRLIHEGVGHFYLWVKGQ
jgi:uncharacterized SAM-binding protein YcdF (DUF218 family)